MWRYVEFAPRRLANDELVARDVLDLGPSAYLPPTGVTEAEEYDTSHLNRVPQWDGIPYWYHPSKKSHGPMCQFPAIKPLIYRDATFEGKY